MFVSDDKSASATLGGHIVDRLGRALQEVHRRSVWQVIGLYVLAGWVVLQIVDTLTGTLRLPEWFPPFALVLLLLGFPMVIATAFVQRGHEEPPPISELPPDLLDRPAQGPRAVDKLFTWKNAFGGGILAFALWGVIAAAWVFVIGGPPQRAEAAPVGQALGPWVNTELPAVAILPLADLSETGDFQYFADGIQEELLARLSKASGLLVLSRTSVLRYRAPEMDIVGIAEELGAAAVVEGSVRRIDDRVRVTLQLIEARSGAHLWAESYDGDLTDPLALQSRIALAATAALEGALVPVELTREGSAR